MKTVISLSNTFEQATHQLETYYLAAEKLLEGNPKQTLHIQYTDPAGEFFVGLWSSEVGKWKVQYTEEEFCCMLVGISVITDENGHSLTVQAGDEFVIPSGFIGTWEVIKPSTKRFVIYERKR
ncbi:MAG: cupin domain-containing protein [Thiolinea sp.]